MSNWQKIIGSIWLHRLEITCNLGLPDATCNTPEDHQINIFLSWNMQNIVVLFIYLDSSYFSKMVSLDCELGVHLGLEPELDGHSSPSLNCWQGCNPMAQRWILSKTSAYLKSIQLIVSTICPESIVWINFYQVLLNGTSHYKRK